MNGALGAFALLIVGLIVFIATVAVHHDRDLARRHVQEICDEWETQYLPTYDGKNFVLVPSPYCARSHEEPDTK